MQNIRHCIRRLAGYNVFATNKSDFLSDALKTSCLLSSCNVRNYMADSLEDKKVKRYLRFNETIFPPQKPGEEKRPGYVCHMKENIKYSPKKMWYIACFVRGMTVEEAVKQLSFLKKKGAAIVKDVILEAQRMAVEEHNIEYKTNLWVSESFTTKGTVIMGARRCRSGNLNKIRYRHCHYFVCLEEGKPPKHYYLPAPKTGEELLDDWMNKMHHRKIPNSL